MKWSNRCWLPRTAPSTQYGLYIDNDIDSKYKNIFYEEITYNNTYLALPVVLHFSNYIQVPGCINELGPL